MNFTTWRVRSTVRARRATMYLARFALEQLESRELLSISVAKTTFLDARLDRFDTADYSPPDTFLASPHAGHSSLGLGYPVGSAGQGGSPRVDSGHLHDFRIRGVDGPAHDRVFAGLEAASPKTHKKVTDASRGHASVFATGAGDGFHRVLPTMNQVGTVVGATLSDPSTRPATGFDHSPLAELPLLRIAPVDPGLEALPVFSREVASTFAQDRINMLPRLGIELLDASLRSNAAVRADDPTPPVRLRPQYVRNSWTGNSLAAVDSIGSVSTAEDTGAAPVYPRAARSSERITAESAQSASLAIMFDAAAQVQISHEAVLDDYEVFTQPTDQLLGTGSFPFESGLLESPYRESGSVPVSGGEFSALDDGFIDISFSGDGSETVLLEKIGRENREPAPRGSSSGRLPEDASDPHTTAHSQSSDDGLRSQALETHRIDESGEESTGESEDDGATGGSAGRDGLALAPDPDAGEMIELWAYADTVAAGDEEPESEASPRQPSSAEAHRVDHSRGGIEVDESCGISQAFELATVSEDVRELAPADGRRDETNDPPLEPVGGPTAPSTREAAESAADNSADEDVDPNWRTKVAAVSALSLVAARRRWNLSKERTYKLLATWCLRLSRTARVGFITLRRALETRGFMPSAQFVL